MAVNRLIQSKFFIAVILFGICSALASGVKLWQARPTDFPYLSWTAWAIKDFVEMKERPDLVFMGSSLMLVPLGGVDADYLKHRVDGSQHHRSHYFENKLAEKTGVQARTFNFALPGEMPSDAYMITDYLLKGDKQPKVIVYGVGPRDFMDNLLPSPSATDPYRFLSRFGDVKPKASRLMPEVFDRLNYELGQLCYFYGKKVDLVVKAEGEAKKQFQAFLPPPQGGASFTRDELRQLMPEHRAFELGKGEAFFRPSTPADHAAFVDNVEEYRKRYKKLKRETFDSQMAFFSDVLEIARQRGIRAVVVAMPITDINRSLLNDQAWSLYRNELKNVVASKGATLVDFSENTSFKRSDFGDTVHLHSGGGKLLLDLVLDSVAKDQQVMTALSETKLDLASKQGGQL